MAEFKVGERVVCVYCDDRPELQGEHGRVIASSLDEELPYLVEYDHDINGHSGNYCGTVTGKEGHCWWMETDAIELEYIPESEEG